MWLICQMMTLCIWRHNCRNQSILNVILYRTWLASHPISRPKAGSGWRKMMDNRYPYFNALDYIFLKKKFTIPCIIFWFRPRLLSFDFLPSLWNKSMSITCLQSHQIWLLLAPFLLSFDWYFVSTLLYYSC